MGVNLYKFVLSDAEKFVSYADDKFEYPLGEYVKAEFRSEDSGIYCFYKHGVNGVAEATKRDFKLIEMSVLESDFIRDEGGRVCVYKAVTPLRVVEREEYAEWANEGENRP